MAAFIGGQIAFWMGVGTGVYLTRMYYALVIHELTHHRKD